MSDRSELIRRADAWSAADPDETTRAELQKLLTSEDFAELEDRFAGTLEFGTAGLRGVVGAGPNRMNRAVVRSATAGLAAYLLATVPDAARRGVVVARDGRRMSKEFAEDTAAVRKEMTEAVRTAFDKKLDGILSNDQKAAVKKAAEEEAKRAAENKNKPKPNK